MITEIGGVLKTIRVLRQKKNKKYNASNLYRWRDRGYIPPSYWRLVTELTNDKVDIDMLLREYESVHPM